MLLVRLQLNLRHTFKGLQVWFYDSQVFYSVRNSPPDRGILYQTRWLDMK
jgi:hypothetical protein